eukprot:7378726-Prymnesium_polylepis.1
MDTRYWGACFEWAGWSRGPFMTAYTSTPARWHASSTASPGLVWALTRQTKYDSASVTRSLM